MVVKRVKVTSGDHTLEDTFVTGTTDQYNTASGNKEIDGRFFSAEESNGGRPVCVIGATVAELLGVPWEAMAGRSFAGALLP